MSGRLPKAVEEILICVKLRVLGRVYTFEKNWPVDSVSVIRDEAMVRFVRVARFDVKLS